jgi:betaine-aldehyde dehydrogenase
MSEPILIGGEWKAGRGPDMVSVYPADGSENAVVAGANAADVDEAVAHAKAAMAEPAWRDMKPHDRGSLLMRVSQLISERAQDLARLQMRDNGKPIGETRVLVASAAGTFRYYGAVAETMEEEITPSRGPFVSMSIYDPIGVVAAITPWNSPIASDAQKLAPALAAGCAVILKPAGVTPLVALELGRICEAAGIPKGIVSVLPGPGAVIGDALVTHPDIARVAFTGGTEVGRGIARQAAEKLMPVSLELGGKSPTIVFEDAQIDHAVNGVIFGIFSSSGESCIAGSRLFVHRKILDQFTEALVAKTAQLRIGDPAAETTQMGPLVSVSHREGIEKYVALGREEGGEILTGGARPEDGGYTNPAGGDFAYSDGSFYLPTIFTGLGNDARMVQEEIFGPVLAILPFDDEEDLIAQANDTVFGLACGLWTEDYRRAWRLARRIDAGTVWINTYKLFSIATPFGGLKDSGTGREKGRQGIRQYQEQKSLYWGMNEAPLGWAD